jgi:hypothetical protein
VVPDSESGKLNNLFLRYGISGESDDLKPSPPDGPPSDEVF